MLSVLQRIAAERLRQIGKGYTPEHDDSHTDGELVTTAHMALHWDDSVEVPWPKMLYKIRDNSEKERLIIAASLLVAEIERLERIENSSSRS